MATLFITSDNSGGGDRKAHVVDVSAYVTMYADLPADVQPSDNELVEYLVADVQSRLALEPIGEDVLLRLGSVPDGNTLKVWKEVASACGADIEFV